MSGNFLLIIQVIIIFDISADASDRVTESPNTDVTEPNADTTDQDLQCPDTTPATPTEYTGMSHMIFQVNKTNGLFISIF